MKNNRTVLLVHNPVAGTSDAEEMRRLFEKYFAKGGQSLHVYTTNPEKNTIDEVRERLDAESFAFVIAAGGDGTLSQVATAMQGFDIPLGILPLGTGNALARHFGISLDPEEACMLINGAHEHVQMDAARVGGHLYLLGISLGLSARLIKDTSRDQKRRFGFLAYIWNGLRNLARIRMRRLHIKIDGTSLSKRALEVAVANTPTMGVEGFAWGPDITLDDGQLDVCFYQAASFASYLRLIWGLAFNRQRQVSEVTCYKASDSIRIDSRGSFVIQGDGEIIGKTPLEIEVVPQALQVIVPVEYANKD